MMMMMMMMMMNEEKDDEEEEEEDHDDHDDGKGGKDTVYLYTFVLPILGELLLHTSPFSMLPNPDDPATNPIQ